MQKKIYQPTHPRHQPVMEGTNKSLIHPYVKDKKFFLWRALHSGSLSPIQGSQQGVVTSKQVMTWNFQNRPWQQICWSSQKSPGEWHGGLLASFIISSFLSKNDHQLPKLRLKTLQMLVLAMVPAVQFFAHNFNRTSQLNRGIVAKASIPKNAIINS